MIVDVGRCPRWTGLFWAAVLLTLSTSCQSYLQDSAIVKATYTKDMFCPPERVSVEVRRGLQPHMLLRPEVASDPQRLAYWKRRQAAAAAKIAGKAYYVASGCGERHAYDCSEDVYDENSDRVCLSVDLQWDKYAPSPSPCADGPACVVRQH